MGLKLWQKIGECSRLHTLKDTFHLLTTTLLSLLLPLSFLLLARFSTAYYLLALNVFPPAPQSAPSAVFSLFLYATPINPMHALVSAISIAALIHSLSSGRNPSTSLLKIPLPESGLKLSESGLRLPESGLKPRLCTAWIMLCMLHVCVGLGIEGSIGAGIDGFGFGKGRSFVCRLIFFLGLHETMMYWLRTVVKPVVDDTIYSFEREEKFIERVVIAASFGSLWWWRLREEVESLVVVAELIREMDVGVGVAAFLGWWLYYLTVTIGMVRVVKGIIWFGMILLCKRVERQNAGNEPLEHEEKV